MKTILIALFLSFNSQAHEVIWKINDKFIALYEDKTNNLLYSSSCTKLSCDAIEKTKEITWREFSLNGGKNPGAVLCLNILKQKILILKDLAGNENSFCLFQDRSLISSSSLSYLADKNSKKIKKKIDKTTKK